MRTAAPIYDLVIAQNADTELSFFLEYDEFDGDGSYEGDPVDITGYRAWLQIRETFAGEVLLELDSFDEYLGDGTLTVDGPVGRVTMRIPSETALALEFGDAVYDLLYFTAEGKLFRTVQGPATLDLGVTR